MVAEIPALALHPGNSLLRHPLSLHDENTPPPPEPLEESSAEPYAPSTDFDDLHAASEHDHDSYSYAAKTLKPHQLDPNYQALAETRDILLNIARKPGTAIDRRDRLKIESALGAARVAGQMIEYFGVEVPQRNDIAEEEAIKAGREAARRACNIGIFGGQTPRKAPEWSTSIGDPNPKRRGQ